LNTSLGWPQGCKKIIAINENKGASIFCAADFGPVNDLFSPVPDSVDEHQLK